MRILRRLTSLWSTLFRKERLEHELDEEIRAAVDMLAERHAARGMDAKAAHRAAVSALGGPAGIVRVKADVRDGRIGAGLDALLVDLAHAWRGLRKAPGFTAVIVMTLALGIGANTAIFSVVHAMLLEPVPYRDADRLVFIWLDRTAARSGSDSSSALDQAAARRRSSASFGISSDAASSTVCRRRSSSPGGSRSGTRRPTSCRPGAIRLR